MSPTDDVAGNHESALVVVISAITVLRGIAALRDVYPNLPALDLNYGNVLDVVAFAMSVGDAIDPWFAEARKVCRDIDVALYLEGL